MCSDNTNGVNIGDILIVKVPPIVTLPSKLPVVAVNTPVTTTPAGFACALTLPPLSLIDVASMPVNADPSPANEVAVNTPVTTPAGFACAFILPPLSLSVVASIPVKLEPSPKYVVAIHQ